MAIEYPNFQGDPTQRPTFSALENLVPNLMKGYQFARQPEKDAMERKKQELANAYMELQQKYYPREKEADIAYKAAQTSQLNDPMRQFQRGFSGDAQNAYVLDSLRRQAEANPELIPTYEAAKKAFDLDQAAKQSMIDYRGAYADTIGQRFVSPLGKLNKEQLDVQQGFVPGTNREEKIPEEQKQDFENRYGLSILKSVSTPTILARNIYATNIDKTLDAIDPDVLTSYSGALGTAEKGANKLLAPFGFESKNYDDYMQNVTRATFAAMQIRQFLGESVQPEVAKKLDNLMNPSYWSSNPKLAKKQFETAVDVYRKERETYQEAVTSPKAYIQNEDKPTPKGLLLISDSDLDRLIEEAR